jgi:type IV secretion system protein VirB4
VLALIEGFVPEAAWLSDAETLTYLHACISTRRHRVRTPDVPMYLDAFLADEPLIGGLAPRSGSTHLRVLSIMGFPAATYPGILDELNRLAFPYRWSTRAICLDKTDANRLLTRIRRQWFAKRKSVAAILKEVMTNEASTLLDSDAHNKALDADAALQELGADFAGEAYVTATLTVSDENPQTAARFGIQSIPTMILFKSGKPVDQIVGAMPLQPLQARLERHLSPSGAAASKGQ